MELSHDYVAFSLTLEGLGGFFIGITYLWTFSKLGLPRTISQNNFSSAVSSFAMASPDEERSICFNFIRAFTSREFGGRALAAAGLRRPWQPYDNDPAVAHCVSLEGLSSIEDY